MPYYKPLIRKCEDCGLASEEVQPKIMLKMKTPIISSAYLNTWTNLCESCEEKRVAKIERLLSFWPQATDPAESAQAKPEAVNLGLGD